MSNPLAIAAATATIRNLLDRVKDDFPETDITAIPPDQARKNENRNQINIFLYHTTINAAWRNMDMPRKVKAGETGQPPLALNLYYLLTAYGKDNKDFLGHSVLGNAMSILHDHPLLGAEEIKDALSDNDLYDQLERVRITPHPLSVDDLFKLWSAFQTEYRISVAYQVSVVLIESTRPVRTPLPVLERNVTAKPSITPPPSPFPSIKKLLLPNRQSGICLGDTLTIHGYHLDGDIVKVIFMTSRLEDPIELDPEANGTDTEVKIILPDNAAAYSAWPAGFYKVSLSTKQAGKPRQTTNQMPLTLAPRIQNINPNPAALVNNVATLNVSCQPKVQPEQHVRLLLGHHEISPQEFNAITDKLTFKVSDISPGEYFARLRVDGVDSHLIDPQKTPPGFYDSQKVEITE